MTLKIQLTQQLPELLTPKLCIQLVRDFVKLPVFQAQISPQLQNAGRILSSEGVKLSVKKSAAVHITSHLPQGGKIIARNRFSLPPSDYDPQWKEVMIKSLCVVRPTIHFTTNCVVPHHSQHKIDDHAIAILQPVERTNLMGGYLEDMFLIGPQILPEGSIVIAPNALKEDSKTREELESLSKTFKIVYRSTDEKVQEAVKRVMIAEKLETFSPQKTDNPENEIYIFEDLKKNSVLTTDWMQALKRPLCTHAVTPMRQIELMLIGSPVLSIPPFHSSLYCFGHQNVESLVREYIAATKEAFPELPKYQLESLGAYENNLVQLLKLYNNSKTISELYNKWDAMKASILNYDKPIIASLLSN